MAACVWGLVHNVDVAGGVSELVHVLEVVVCAVVGARVEVAGGVVELLHAEAMVGKVEVTADVLVPVHVEVQAAAAAAVAEMACIEEVGTRTVAGHGAGDESCYIGSMDPAHLKQCQE